MSTHSRDREIFKYVMNQDLAVNNINVDELTKSKEIESIPEELEVLFSKSIFPVIVDKDTNIILDGNKRHKFAEDNDISQLPVIYLSGISSRVKEDVLSILNKEMGA